VAAILGRVRGRLRDQKTPPMFHVAQLLFDDLACPRFGTLAEFMPISTST
jgi:hypothetical protein